MKILEVKTVQSGAFRVLIEALKEAFSNKSFIYLTLGFLYVVGILH